MRDEYDFSNARQNPYAARIKKQITMNVDANIIEYFKNEADRNGIPYQTLINLYLRDCMLNGRKFSPSWA